MKTTILFLLALLSTQAFAQSIKNSLAGHKNQLHIIIHQADPKLAGAKHQLTIGFSEIPSTTRLAFNSIDTVFKDRLDYRAFNLEIPANKGGMRINYSINGRTGTAFRGAIRDYLVRAGDTIEMKISKDSLLFLGKTAKLLNIQSEIFILERPVHNELNYEDPTYFEQRNAAYEKMFKNEVKFIEMHKNKLDVEFYRYLKNQAIGYRHYLRIKLISGSSIISPELGTRAAKYYLKNPVHVALPEDKNLDQASNFIDFLYQKERLDYETANPSTNFQRKGGAIILDNIAKKYSGRIRDRVLIVAFIGLSKSYLDVSTYFSNHDSLIPETSPYYNVYRKISHAFDPQVPAYNFALQDTAGRIVKLSDFRGKAVLLDFWFTGCKPCLYLKAAMVPVMEEFKEKKDLVFITINVDKEKKLWIKSIHSGLYTHSGSINLIAPEGKDPVLKNYNISSFPRLMLIGKTGKMVSMKLPTPHREEGKKELIETIKKALNN